MDAYIVAGYRSPVGKAVKGVFNQIRSDDIAAQVIRRLTKTLSLDPKFVDDLIVGNAMPEAEQGMQMGRMVSLLSLGEDVSGVLVNRWCASGLEAIAQASYRIHANQADCIIAGGTESMSMIPMGGFKKSLNWNLAKEHADYYLSMGHTSEEVAKKYKIGRDLADQFSLRSHQKALHAMTNGFFNQEIAPIEVDINVFKDGKKKNIRKIVNTDEGPRQDANLEALSKLKPVFSRRGITTAGSSSQMSDGAAFVVLMSERALKETNNTPLARLVSYATAGIDPKVMGIGPVKAVPKALKYASLSLADIDHIELNEAFATQSLAVIKNLDLDLEKVNPNGGAIALGHPLGCTGAKLSVHLIHDMKRKQQRYGIVTACVGGGQGVAGVYEVL